MDGDAWQLAPSGMVEASPSPTLLVRSVQRELAEELGIRVSLENLSERLLPLGFVVDLLRLRPEACVQFEAVDGEIGAEALSLSNDEFADAKFSEISAGSMARFWSDHSPSDLTPATAGAIALLEQVEGI
jgi:8-oxo-dGTP pyrophosphatase MutT (NUDIX family)